MRALVLDGDVRVVDDWPAPIALAGECLIETRTVGVCDTDLQLARGYMGFRGVPGHEVVGEVVASDDPAWNGRRVVADINAGCGRCDDCTERDGHHCIGRTVLGIVGRGGAMAERFTMPVHCLVAVPDHVPDDLAVFAEPLAAALHVLDVPSVAASDSALVLGDGKLGILIALVLRAAGKKTTLVGHHRRKLDVAAASGVETRLEADLTAADRDHHPVVVEATGSAGGLARGLELCRPLGTLVLKTTVAGRLDVDLSPVVIKEIVVAGSRCGNLRSALEWLAQGRIDPRPLVEARYPLGQADFALSHASRKGALKVLLEVRGTTNH